MSNRIDKILSIAKKDTAQFILKNYQGNQFITISSMTSNKDFTKFEVELNIYPRSEKDLNLVFSQICPKLNVFQKFFARKHNLRKIPVFKFKLSQNQNQIDSMDKLLKQISNERH